MCGYMEENNNEHGMSPKEALGNRKAQGANQMASSHIDVDPIKRVKVLDAAQVQPCYVDNNDDLSKAITLMLMHDYSQLPVTNNKLHGICGFISWKTIGIALYYGIRYNKVKDFIDKDIVKLDLEDPLMDVVDKVYKHDFAVVTNSKKELCGIITTADITSQFISNTGPFIYIEQIESFLRILLKDAFTIDEIKNVCIEPERANKISSIDDLTFGEYLRLIENEDNWNRLNLQLDRKLFLQRMDEIRQIRNDIMHFEPAGITSVQKHILIETSNFLEKIVELKSKKRQVESCVANSYG